MPTEFVNLKGNLTLLSIILGLQSTNTIKARLVSVPFLRSIATLLDNCDVYSFPGADEFINALFLVVESVSSNIKVLLAFPDPILTYLTPALISKLRSDSTNVRFVALKIFTDLVTTYLNDSSMYGGSEDNGTLAGKINDVLLK